jgi:hypothetical protein
LPNAPQSKTGSFEFAALTITPTKVSKAFAMTTELLDAITSVETIYNEARAAARDGADVAVLADLTAVNVAESVGLDDLTSVTNDIAELIRSVDWGEGSSLYLCVSPSQCAHLIRLGYLNGINDLGPNGGTFMGLRVLVTRNLPSGNIMLVDATGLAMAATDIELRVSRQADMQLNDASTQSASSPTATTLTSAWQTGSVYAIVERTVGVALARPRAAATLTGATYGSTDSPQ